MYNNLIKLASKKNDTHQKLEDDEKRKAINRESLRALASTVAGTGGFHVANTLLYKKLMDDAPKNVDPAKMQIILDKIKEHAGGKEPVQSPAGLAQTYNLPGKKLTLATGLTSVLHPYSSSDAYQAKKEIEQNKIWKTLGVGEELNNATSDPSRRSQLIHAESPNPSLFLHELGHSTGSGRDDTIKHKLINANRKLYGKSHNYAFTKNPIASAIAPSLASITKKRDGESEEDYMDRRQKRRHIANVATAIPTLPLLAEEARASINAYKLGKKMGVPVDKKALGVAFGTYASSLIPNMARAVTDTVAHRAEKTSLKNRQKNS